MHPLGPSTKGNKELASPWYSDQILPFDITLAATNEQGRAAASKIFGVEILNEGYGVSIDDAVSEMQATFVARAVEPLAAVPGKFDAGFAGGIPIDLSSCRMDQVPLSGRQPVASRARASRPSSRDTSAWRSRGPHPGPRGKRCPRLRNHNLAVPQPYRSANGPVPRSPGPLVKQLGWDRSQGQRPGIMTLLD